MKTRSLFLASCLFFIPTAAALFGADASPIQRATCAQAEAPADDAVKSDPKPADFYGRWVGKWDDKWKVQYTIIPNPDTEGSLYVMYEHEENLGRPLRSAFLTGTIDKHTLKAGQSELTLSAKDPKKAKAFGDFQNPRRADLTRELDADEAANSWRERFKRD